MSSFHCESSLQGAWYGRTYFVAVIIFDFVFSESSELYATSSHDDVRVWHAETGKELLRITNSNMICHAVLITPDGKAIITG